VLKKSTIPIPRTIWVLGFVSLFMDLSSELIHSLLPVFLVTTLGASALTVGLIEGIAEATAHIIKVFSGAISDFFGRRKILLMLGIAYVLKPRQFHDLHVWSLSTTEVALSVHLIVNDASFGQRVLPKLQQSLHKNFNIEHSTIQIKIKGDVPCKLDKKGCI
jgi:Na+/melibiose symporter-like transporter